MISKMIEWCGKNKAIVALVTLLFTGWGYWSLKNIPLDAIPDISDTQVVVYAQWMRSPDILEDQVATPIVRALLGAPKVKAVPAFSGFRFAYVYVLFEDWAGVYLA